MGVWGTSLFSDDFAADIHDQFRDLVSEGCAAEQATENLLTEYAECLNDPDEQLVFWLALAATQWQLGRIQERVKREALRIIESGDDLKRWDDLRDRKRRKNVLEKLRSTLSSPAPEPKKVQPRLKGANNWDIGEVIGFRLQSERWTLLRVVGHHEDRGGRFAVCELLDWTGTELPPEQMISQLSIKREQSPRGVSQFLLGEPKTKRDKQRLVRLGIKSVPSQCPGRYTGFVWPYVDRLMQQIFGLT